MPPFSHATTPRDHDEARMMGDHGKLPYIRRNMQNSTARTAMQQNMQGRTQIESIKKHWETQAIQGLAQEPQIL